MKIYLIRHGKTYGNTLGRYIGRTDEPLCEEGAAQLSGIRYPEVPKVFVSPLLRCRQTAELLYPGIPQTVVPGFAECDFGDFENQNYRELDGNPDYQRWIDSGGTLPFPGGESQEAFRSRSAEAFVTTVGEMSREGLAEAAMVVHGGTIMAVMERFAVPHAEFYHWHAENAEGFAVSLEETKWRNEIREAAVICRLRASAGGEDNVK